MIYFENFSFVGFVTSLFRYNLLKKLSSKEYKSIYYIDASLSARRFILPLLRFFGLSVKKLQFTMLEIVGSNGELVRTRIPREDLINFQEKIIASEVYKSLYHETWKQASIADYINKGLIDEGVMDADSVSRVLFIINVVFWHMKKLDYNRSVLVIKNRAWIDLYKKYAEGYKIELLSFRSILFKLSYLKKIVRSFPWFYKIVKNIKYRNFSQKYDFKNLDNNKIYIDGRGDISLVNNGHHSDFFWQLNSNFSTKNIVCKHHSKKEKEYLSKHGIFSIAEGVYSDRGDYRKYTKPKLNYSYSHKKESQKVQAILNSYDLDRFYWASLFKQHGVKIFLTWNKYQNNQIAWLDAIRDNGGISVVWQMAFDGFRNAECVLKSDVAFSFSKFSIDIEKKLGSKIKHNVVIGYPKDYSASLLKEEALKLREKLKANGAKKIVLVIDENSHDDSRWHTGHGLQRENYSHILEKILEIPWLGVIFKPKRIIDLRQRLGPVSELLKEAEETGRCYIYEDSGKYTTSAPPILAGLSADICIHSHLCSGTAALECALEGLPTLLINREGVIDSKLNQLPQEKVVFKDWPSTINALIEHFNSPKGISGFGDWTSILDDLDPFRDGMAAYRMGTFLEWLIEGFEKNLDREVIMTNAAERYKKQWGEDKVITS